MLLKGRKEQGSRLFKKRQKKFKVHPRVEWSLWRKDPRAGRRRGGSTCVRKLLRSQGSEDQLLQHEFFCCFPPGVTEMLGTKIAWLLGKF